MPVEIKEIIVRAVVDPSAGGGGGAAGGGGKEDPVRKAVDQVMKILKDKQER
jgi:hypothetical protein